MKLGLFVINKISKDENLETERDGFVIIVCLARRASVLPCKASASFALWFCLSSSEDEEVVLVQDMHFLFKAGML